MLSVLILLCLHSSVKKCTRFWEPWTAYTGTSTLAMLFSSYSLSLVFPKLEVLHRVIPRSETWHHCCLHDSLHKLPTLNNFKKKIWNLTYSKCHLCNMTLLTWSTSEAALVWLSTLYQLSTWLSILTYLLTSSTSALLKFWGGRRYNKYLHLYPYLYLYTAVTFVFNCTWAAATRGQAPSIPLRRGGGKSHRRHREGWTPPSTTSNYSNTPQVICNLLFDVM